MSDRSLPILYDSLFQKAQGVLDKHNPCDVQDGVCYAARKRGVTQADDQRNFCCQHCEYLGENGRVL